MRKIIKKGTVLAAAAVLLTGCGEPMASLTEREEDIVVQYSAGTLAKHNSYQQEGMTAVYPEEEEPEEDEPKQEDTEEKKEPKTQDSEEQKNPEKEQKKEENNSKTDGQLTMTKAMGISGVEFSYKDYSIVSGYSQGDYFSLDASPGNVFFVLNVNITNTGNKTVQCDLLTKQPIFTLKLNGEAGVQNVVTVLSNDLSTYVGTLEPGQTEAAILLFEVKEATAEKVTSMQVSLQMNDKTSEIKIK